MSEPALISSSAAEYLGGHPELSRTRMGTLNLYEDALVFTSNQREEIEVFLDEIDGMALEPAPVGLLKSMFVNDPREITVYTPVINVAATIEDLETDIRYHILGSVTLPGNMKRARSMLNEITSARHEFRQQLKREEQARRLQEEVAPPPSPPQWAADPYGRFELRWWDGAHWTPHVQHQGNRYTEPNWTPAQ